MLVGAFAEDGKIPRWVYHGDVSVLCVVTVIERPREVPVFPTEIDDRDATDEAPTLSSYPRCADGNGTLTHLFFAEDETSIARAKAICGKCGLASACLQRALDTEEPYGVWGGQLVIDGAIVARKRGRGRPPKNPRPPLVVDEVPIPEHLVA